MKTNNKSCKKIHKNPHKRKIPAKDLQSIFKTLPNITCNQLLRLKKSAPPRTYKKLKFLCLFINQTVINDLQKEANSFMQMAKTISNNASDVAFSNLVEG